MSTDLSVKNLIARPHHPEYLLQLAAMQRKMSPQALYESLEWDVSRVNDYQGGLPFTYVARAAEVGHLDAVKDLIGRGADLSQLNQGHTTALHCLVISKRLVSEHAAVVACLVGAGIDVNAKTASGATALMLACMKKCELGLITEILKAPSIDVTIEDTFGCQAIHYAELQGLNDVCEILRKKAEK